MKSSLSLVPTVRLLTTALTVGILKEAYGEIVTNPSGANMITGLLPPF